MYLIEYACPACIGELKLSDSQYCCSKCCASYLVDNGVVDFIGKSDSVYEGKFVSSITYNRSLKDIARHLLLRRLKFLKSSLDSLSKGKPLKILDLACGGGHEVLNCYGNVFGVDLSYQSLRVAKNYYAGVACADAAKLPFKSETFDVVVAFDFFGHIEKINKKAVLDEISRVLKVGGTTIQYIETLGENSMQNLALNHVNLYQKYFIEREGHVGLEPPRVVLERFYGRSLIPVSSVGAYKSWMKPPGEIQGRFDNGYLYHYPWLRPLVYFDKAICKVPVIRMFFTLLIEILTVIMDHFYKFERSDGLFLVAVKCEKGNYK